MADIIYSSLQALENKDSFYNVIRTSGMGATPFWDMLNEGIAFRGNTAKGHNFQYRPGAQAGGGATNAYAEGSKRADITSFPTVNLVNQLQIFKKTSGLTGSQASNWTIEEQTSSIETQEVENRKQLRLDVEAAMVGEEAPVAAAALTDVRKMGGIKHYIPAGAKFDLANAALSVKNHIDEALQLMHVKGLSGENAVVMAGAAAFQDLNWYWADKKLLKNNDTGIFARKTTISTGWFENVAITANPNFAENEILVFAPSLINPVLLRQHKSKVVSSPEYDLIAKEDLFELTIQILDPYAAVWIKNAGAMA